MTFLNGLLAGFAALGAVPVIIHLLNRRRFKIVTWAAMDFLLATIEKNSRRVQFRDLILMLLRVGTIVFLALALARPTLTPDSISFMGSQGASSAVIVLDNSLSMDLQSGGESRFAIAKRKARALVENLPKGSKAAFILLSDVAIEEVPKPSQDLAFVADQIAQATISDGGTDIQHGVAAAWRILADNPAAGREIHLVSDMQAGAWPSHEDAAWSRLQDDMRNASPPVSLYLTTVDDGRRDNLGVVEFHPDDELVTTESNVTFTATLRNHGPSPMSNVPVELLVGGPRDERLRKVAGLVLDEVSGTREVHLETRFTEGGEHRIQVQAGIDPLLADNRRHLAIDVLDSLRVLLVDGDPGRHRDPFGGDTGFLASALSPEEENVDDRAAILTEVTTVPGLRDKNLRDYHAVVLANVGDLPPGVIEGLKTLVKTDGKGLLIFLGDQVRAEHYNNLLYDEAGLLPGTLDRLIVAEDNEEFGLAVDDLSHPVVNFFMHPETRRYLSQPRFRKAFSIAMPDSEGSDAGQEKESHVVARFVGGDVAIAERKAGRGTVLLFASSANRDWNDLPLYPAYLMLVRRATQHVTLGPKASRTVQTNAPITLTLGAKEAGQQMTLNDPESERHEVTALLSNDGHTATVSYNDTDDAGFYSIARSDAPGRMTWFAVNTPRRESDLSSYDEKELRDLYPNLTFQWIERDSAIDDVIAEKRVGKEIWPWLFALAACCLLAEWLLAMFWAPKEV